ncbi:hypothetical protein NDU88_002308 [Pleurodeles waltl]|uniref:Uncharacterized protein n=1 Tax=Pleurodeles waltl TaxID=8319 RepID=A0AAV7UWS1_PLEWA|nr:hypothetical protein NDU88_002308 [Pleurodeles waltl]
MGKDRANKGTQQTRMDQYTAQNAGASLQKDHPGPSEKGVEPTGVQILAAIESSSRATQTQIAAIAVDVNLLRADLRVVVERSVATEQKVTCMQSDVETLKASETLLEAQTHKLCLDQFPLANDGSLDVRRVAYQVWLLSDHTPLLLECETHIPKPAIPLWHLRPDLLGDPEYKQDLQGVLNGYFSTNWGTATARGIEWEALKVVIRGESLSKTHGIRKRLDQELTQQEDVLAVLQRHIKNCDASELDCLAVRCRIVELWDRLGNYVRRNYRQRLYWEWDRSGRMLAWLLRLERPVPIIQMFCGPSGAKILGQLQVNSHLREHL